ncbi:MAG: phosphoglycerate kinase [Candidatus Saccharibacteria bacterium]|nr:phosphoglycerate kinase [Candidatus Saccharibacteria bacterium]
MNKKTIRDIDVKDKTVLVRVDYNVPLKNGHVAGDIRIKASLPTIEYLKEHGAKRIILISHLGRPEGQKVPEMSLEPVVSALQNLLPDTEVKFVPDVSGPDVEEAVELMPDGGVLLLENLRFFPGEEENSREFIQEIINSTHAQIFVQDGFAVIHRAHASTEAITHELPSVMGLLVEKEVAELTKATENPEHPVLLIIGGAKVDDKQPLIDALADKVDQIAVVGKIAADGYTPAPEIADKVYVADEFSTDETGAKLDISKDCAVKVAMMASDAKTVIWNGVAGMVEKHPFDAGSATIAMMIGSSMGDQTSIICGGDTTAFVEDFREMSLNTAEYSLISTGGGASLEFLTGKTLPGLEAIEDK